MRITTDIPSLALTHGQARWVLMHTGPRVGSEETLDSYLKYLRRHGVPFGRHELKKGRGYNIQYQYPHLMELALALYMRSQNILKRDVVALLIKERKRFRDIFNRAYLEREGGLGAPVQATYSGGDADKSQTSRIEGVYLDLNLTYISSGILTALEPRLIGPCGALIKFGARHRGWYPRPPIPLSQLADDVVRLALEAPPMPRGRKS